MLVIGVPRYVDFRVSSLSGTPVTELSLGSFSVIFRRNNVSCVDPLTFHNFGDGSYSVSYTPSATGHDYVELYNTANDTRVIDQEDIVTQDNLVGGGDVSSVDQNYTGAGNLQVTVANPENWKLLIFASTDWDLNHRNDADALGITSLDTQGNWINPITLPLGKYHIVVRRQGQIVIIKAYFEVPQ